MNNRRVLNYKIIEKIGGGGMGVVYKALDEKLDRIIALKFLPEHLLDDSEAEQRFISEAKAASSLDHPNICTIYDIDHTDDNKLFIAMAYYDGETLKKKISRGRLSTDEAVNIASQVADGLNRAHLSGITHRDIKPANIMITQYGEVKIVDFGLAKSKASAGLTNFGSTVGTAAYMSPEQTRGETVDGRTDIWAIGIILYEMVTGVAPFKGEYDQAIIYSILNDELPEIDGIPEELKKILNKATAKNPSERYQNISEMHSDLLLL
ncbi:MAG: serine/threonine protein kinase, partial [Ignavibacteriaceae bacterium]|nr:serine/threonine protein kinase [Ignavibacteriaceae bacterium]